MGNRTRTRRCVGCTADFTYAVSRGTDRRWCSKECRQRATLDANKRRLASHPRCSVDGCARPSRSRTASLCEMHYARVRRHGSTDSVIRKPKGSCYSCGAACERQRLFCSSVCASRDKTGIHYAGSECLTCRKPIDQSKRTDSRYCSVSCLHHAQRCKRYGITPSEFSRMMDSQSNACGICGAETDLVIDHDHQTQSVRGLLCGHCNTGLGMFNDDPAALAAAVEYLRRSSALSHREGGVTA